MHERAVNHLREQDPRLRPWIDHIGLITMPRRRSRDPYLALLESVVYQQLTGAAARTIWNRVLDLFEDRSPLPDRVMGLSDDRLRSAGLSRSKVMSLKDIAAKAIAGDIPDGKRIARMPENEIHDRLTEIRGIGPWTVNMVLIFTLRRPDVMPLNDYGLQKAFKIVYRKRSLPTPKQLLRAAERWRPYRTTAALYLWRIADDPDALKITS